MNKQRKQKINAIKIQLQNLKIELQSILDEEQNSFDNMPENLQNSLRGSESEDAIDILEECTEQLEKTINNLYEII